MTDNIKYPCNPDHNGECLICDCWLSSCAFIRFLNRDYTFETKEELDTMFQRYIQNDNLEI